MRQVEVCLTSWRQSAQSCVETMQMLENKTATFTPQDNEASTHTKMISKELGNMTGKSRRWRLSA